MIPLRVLVVTDRFWPVVDSDALALEQMCRALSGRGHLLRVLTRSWQKYWAARLRIGEIDVLRLAFSARSRFGNVRLARYLNQWLESHRDEFDLLVIDPLSELNSATIQFAARHEFPICLWQAVGADAAAWSAAWSKLRRNVTSISTHACWIVTDIRYADQLREAGANPASVRVLGPSIDCAPHPELPRATARSAIADNHPTLSVAPNESLVVSIGNWNTSRGAGELIDAWRWVRESFPSSRLWLIGNGSEIHKIGEQIRLRQLSNEVIVAGCFDEWSDVLRAADLLIQTEPAVEPPFATLAAMRYGLAVLANRGDRSMGAWLRVNENGFGYLPGDPRRLAQQIVDILERRAERETIAGSARQFVVQRHNLEQAAICLEQLGRDLVEHREKVQS